VLKIKDKKEEAEKEEAAAEAESAPETGDAVTPGTSD
jgi:hypothetical protein